MNKKIEKILSVLDLSREVQRVWLSWFLNHSSGYNLGHISQTSLAELAFKLRDGAIANSKSKVDVTPKKGTWIWNDHPLDWSGVNPIWDWAQRIVYDYIHNLPENRPTFDESYSKAKYHEDYKSYWADMAEPIHWIIAALITKELCDNDIQTER